MIVFFRLERPLFFQVNLGTSGKEIIFARLINQTRLYGKIKSFSCCLYCKVRNMTIMKDLVLLNLST